MKKCIILLFSLLLLLSLIGCSSKNESVSQKNDSVSHYQGYGIETWKNGDKFSVKTDNSEWTVKILPKELTLEQEFGIEAWRSIMSIHLSYDMKADDRIKAIAGIKGCIEALAAQLKVGKMDFKDVYIGFGDIGKALKVFWEMSFVAADRFVGNRDGYYSNPEIYKLRMSLQSQVVAAMTKAY